jgi:tetratricopeptide (TPR) repeat protein
MNRIAAVAARVLVVSAGLVSAGCPNEARKDSIEHQNRGAELRQQKSLEPATTEYKEAVQADKTNYQAYFGLGLTLQDRQMYHEAAGELANAVRLKDDEPMYRMWYGITLYKDAVEARRAEQAKQAGVKIADEDLNLHGVNLDPAVQELTTAIKQNNELWRAHYWLGRAYRDQDKPQLAAQEFTAAIDKGPDEADAYVALSKLYNDWDYTDKAIQIASLGQSNLIAATPERGKVEFELGLAYLDKKNMNGAIEAFQKAISDSGRQNHKAEYMLGTAYFTRAQGDDLKQAKKILEDYSKSAGAGETLDKQQANRMILELAAKQI